MGKYMENTCGNNILHSTWKTTIQLPTPKKSRQTVLKIIEESRYAAWNTSAPLSMEKYLGSICEVQINERSRIYNQEYIGSKKAKW